MESTDIGGGGSSIPSGSPLSSFLCRVLSAASQATGPASLFDAGGAGAGYISGPSNTAIHCVLLLFSHTNFTVIVSGMHRTTPIRPSSPPQKISERKTTSVDRPSPGP